ncbi:MAG TPA: protein kinase [Thermoanaerobaculia bacterium]|jgi:serine/threonine protein kinase
METDTLSSADVPLGSIGLFAPGTSIGERYEVLDVLGSGAYAVVYRVHDAELKRQIAHKVLRPDRASPGVVERFRRELAVARDASSPHLIRIYDIGTSPQAIYLSMELIAGLSLRSIRTGRSHMTGWKSTAGFGGCPLKSALPPGEYGVFVAQRGELFDFGVD